MANIEGQPDHAKPEPAELVTDGISPKALWGTVWAFLAPLLGTGLDALVSYVLGNPSVLGALPPVVQAVAMAVLGALGAATAAWKARPGVVVAAKGS